MISATITAANIDTAIATAIDTATARRGVPGGAVVEPGDEGSSAAVDAGIGAGSPSASRTAATSRSMSAAKRE